MAKTSYGTFDELINLTPQGLQPIMHRLRRIITELHPETIEVVRLGEKSAVYGVGPKKMSEAYAYLIPHSQWVNLGFFRGADLSDPEGMLEGTGRKLRHVKIRSIEQADQPGLRQLIQAAIAERKEALGK